MQTHMLFLAHQKALRDTIAICKRKRASSDTTDDLKSSIALTDQRRRLSCAWSRHHKPPSLGERSTHSSDVGSQACKAVRGIQGLHASIRQSSMCTTSVRSHCMYAHTAQEARNASQKNQYNKRRKRLHTIPVFHADVDSLPAAATPERHGVVSNGQTHTNTHPKKTQ